MRLKTLQWNIGGAQIRRQKADPTDPTSYTHYNIGYFAEIISQFEPDIVSLQETHSNDQIDQVKTLADWIDFEFFFNDIYSDSHLDADSKLGQGILSRFPISNHTFTLLTNPHFETINEDNTYMVSLDKGISHCCCRVEGIDIEVVTLHLFPFRKFGIDPLSEITQTIRDEVVKNVTPTKEHFLLQGDFNINDSLLKPYFPGLFVHHIEETEISTPTTPRERKYDHVLYRGLKRETFHIISNVLSDHYPLYCEFTIS